MCPFSLSGCASAGHVDILIFMKSKTQNLLSLELRLDVDRL